jgi:hypothetical protein
MKKITKQRIGVLLVASIFFMSIISYAIMNVLNPEEEEKEELKEFVIEGELDPETENEYLGRGFTLMKFYYSDSDMIFYVDSLPAYLKTNRNQVQLIVEKIESNETYALITGPYGEEEVKNVTQTSIFNALCDILLFIPLECGYEEITTGNITANTTETNTTS